MDTIVQVTSQILYSLMEQGMFIILKFYAFGII